MKTLTIFLTIFTICSIAMAMPSRNTQYMACLGKASHDSAVYEDGKLVSYDKQKQLVEVCACHKKYDNMVTYNYLKCDQAIAE